MTFKVISQKRVSELIKVRYPDSVNITEMREWCKNNCDDVFFTGTDWENWEYGKHNRCVEFTNEKDATFFALRWA